MAQDTKHVKARIAPAEPSESARRSSTPARFLFPLACLFATIYVIWLGYLSAVAFFWSQA